MVSYKVENLLPLVEDPAELWRGRGRVRVGVISCRISVCYFPLPFFPSHRGRGKFTFYETIIIEKTWKEMI